MTKIKPTVAHPGIASPQGIPARLARYQRKKMFNTFLRTCELAEDDTIADIGATADQTFDSSNYLEAWYPYKDKITAVGIDDASFLEEKYPEIKFVQANGLDLPFEDNSFDVVHSSAVMEHVGSWDNQARFIKECARVARKAIFLTTPNRWFPVEFHTVLPFLHWLPKQTHRNILKALNMRFFASEDNLNLMSSSELKKIASGISKFEIRCTVERLGGIGSNLLLIGRNDNQRAGSNNLSTTTVSP